MHFDELHILQERQSPVYQQEKIEIVEPVKQEKRETTHRVAPKSFSIKNVMAGIPPEPQVNPSTVSKDETNAELPLLVSQELETDEIIDTITPFTQQELEAVWDHFIRSKLSDKANLASLLKGYPPVLSDDYVLKIVFETSLQMDIFREIKHDLGYYLRHKLNNSIISISESVEQQEVSKNRIYTVDEKFKHMSQKNPALIKFKQQLNLDFD